MEIKIKKLSEKAVIPSYAKSGDAGMDLTATSKIANTSYGFVEYGTDLAIEIPEGYVGYIFPRSSVSKTGMNLCNSVGVIDSGYRGEIKCRFNLAGPWLAKALGGAIVEFANSFEVKDYEIGEKIAQLVIMPIPFIELTEVEELTSTERGEGGFGSTNN